MGIYTGRGDSGKTDLRDLSRISKDSLRIEAYGAIDETNSAVGVARPTGYDDTDDMLEQIQNQLFIAQADFANPSSDQSDPQIQKSHVETVEDWIDSLDEDLEPLQAFILPGGSQSGAKLHLARAVCRRAERRAIALTSEEEANQLVVTYLNRLSDALFTLGRVVNQREGIPEENPTY